MEFVKASRAGRDEMHHHALPSNTDVGGLGRETPYKMYRLKAGGSDILKTSEDLRRYIIMIASRDVPGVRHSSAPGQSLLFRFAVIVFHLWIAGLLSRCHREPVLGSSSDSASRDIFLGLPQLESPETRLLGQQWLRCLTRTVHPLWRKV